jgi:hypothetical protein
MSFRSGEFSYRLSLDNGTATYSVTDGKDALSVPVLWSFGSGKAGQTYVFEYQSSLYESRISYYTRVRGLDLTLGAIGSKPDSLLMAAGRKMTAQDVSECFGCHSTGASPASRFNLDTMKPGVRCAACHDGIDKHLGSIENKTSLVRPKPLGKLTAEETSELCGRCHRTWEQISINGPKGIGNVRFQPYRLTNSKCYDADDRRIACVACHDPHTPLETRSHAYDAQCKSCHQPGANSKAASHICKVASRNCTECHMPKYEIPGSHMVFSDHQIRIVHGKEPYPN